MNLKAKQHEMIKFIRQKKKKKNPEVDGDVICLVSYFSKINQFYFQSNTINDRIKALPTILN